MMIIKFSILGVGLLGFAVGFIVQFQLYKHVSKEKVHSIKDPRQLWKNSIPPKKILSEKGKSLHRLMSLGIVLFTGSIVVLIILSRLDS